MFTWYIKKIRPKNKDITFILNIRVINILNILDGQKPGKFSKINKDNNSDLYEICKDFDYKDCDHSYEYYNIGTDNKEKLNIILKVNRKNILVFIIVR